MLTDTEIQTAREDLAAAFRWSARMGMHEAVANHFSFAINEDGTRFLVNPAGIHFARVRASDLIIVDRTATGSAMPPGLSPRAGTPPSRAGISTAR